MKLVDILPKDSISIALKSRKKDEIINEMIDLLAKSPSVRDKVLVSKSIFERERTMSTGIGSGVAIPHGKSAGIERLCAALGMIHDGADFDSIDKKPVHIVVLLASPEGPPGPHIKALSRVSRMLNKQAFREKLLQSKTTADVIEALSEEEKDYFEI